MSAEKSHFSFFSPKSLNPWPRKWRVCVFICSLSVVAFGNIYEFVLVKWVGQVLAAPCWRWENWHEKVKSSAQCPPGSRWQSQDSSPVLLLLCGLWVATGSWDSHLTTCHLNTEIHPGLQRSHCRKDFLGHGIFAKFLILLSDANNLNKAGKFLLLSFTKPHPNYVSAFLNSRPLVTTNLLKISRNHHLMNLMNWGENICKPYI